jgi:hypothetical protein
MHSTGLIELIIVFGGALVFIGGDTAVYFAGLTK